MQVNSHLETIQFQKVETLNSTPTQSNLSPFDKNYTLTGLVRNIQINLSELIDHKKTSKNHYKEHQQSEIHKLVKIREEVGVLKTIIIHNINQIFSDLYPSDQDYKKSDKTNHTRSPTGLKNETQHFKSMIITDFQVETVNEQLEQIKNLEVNKESLSHHNNIYPQIDNLNEPILLSDDQGNEESQRTKVQKQRSSKEITPFELPPIQKAPQIKIEQDEEQDEFDLVCYEDQKSINERKKRKIQEQNKSQKGFSPIIQRPVQEQETMHKQNKNDANITFSQQDKSIFGLTAIQQADLKRQLFSYTSRSKLPDRYPRKKYNYLDKAKMR